MTGTDARADARALHSNKSAMSLTSPLPPTLASGPPVIDTRFRSALARMIERGRLQAYTKTVDVDLEIAGIMKRLDGGPALLFSNVRGHDVPVIGNFLAAQEN